MVYKTLWELLPLPAAILASMVALGPLLDYLTR